MANAIVTIEKLQTIINSEFGWRFEAVEETNTTQYAELVGGYHRLIAFEDGSIEIETIEGEFVKSYKQVRSAAKALDKMEEAAHAISVAKTKADLAEWEAYQASKVQVEATNTTVEVEVAPEATVTVDAPEVEVVIEATPKLTQAQKQDVPVVEVVYQSEFEGKVGDYYLFRRTADGSLDAYTWLIPDRQFIPRRRNVPPDRLHTLVAV